MTVNLWLLLRMSLVSPWTRIHNWILKVTHVSSDRRLSRIPPEWVPRGQWWHRRGRWLSKLTRSSKVIIVHHRGRGCRVRHGRGYVRPIDGCQRGRPNSLQPHTLGFRRVIGRSRQRFLRGWTSELLNNISKVILAYVVNLRLRLLPSGRIVVCKIRLVQRTLPYILPYFIHTQMLIIPILHVIHFLGKNWKSQKSLLNKELPRFCNVNLSQNLTTITNYFDILNNPWPWSNSFRASRQNPEPQFSKLKTIFPELFTVI